MLEERKQGARRLRKQKLLFVISCSRRFRNLLLILLLLHDEEVSNREQLSIRNYFLSFSGAHGKVFVCFLFLFGNFPSSFSAVIERKQAATGFCLDCHTQKKVKKPRKSFHYDAEQCHKDNKQRSCENSIFRLRFVKRFPSF